VNISKSKTATWVNKPRSITSLDFGDYTVILKRSSNGTASAVAVSVDLGYCASSTFFSLSTTPVTTTIARDATAALDLTVFGRSLASNEFLALRIVNLDPKNGVEVMTNDLSAVSGSFH